MDKEKDLWGKKVLWSAETERKLFGHNDHKYEENTIPADWHGAGIVLCSGDVLLPVEQLLYRK